MHCKGTVQRGRKITPLSAIETGAVIAHQKEKGFIIQSRQDINWRRHNQNPGIVQ
jgi:hypothetical protein